MRSKNLWVIQMIGKAVSLDYLDDVITEEFSKVIDGFMAADVDSEPFVHELLDLRNKIYERLGIDE